MESIIDILNKKAENQTVTAKGWVKTFRGRRFISLNDGSINTNLQCVIDPDNFDKKLIDKISTGCSLMIEGILVDSIGKGQKVEIIVNKLKIYGECNPDEYPIQPKKHSFEFLREKAHLRIRTSTFASVMRIRSVANYAIHDFFRKENFFCVHTPIITGSDAEGAGQMFKVTTKKFQDYLLKNKSDNDYSKDFFGKETFLTVSGQLEAETYAMGLSKVYTFGPTFRAENSNTTRHLAEFWMIEPEMAFFDLEDNMDLSEKFIKYILKFIHDNCQIDLNFLNDRLINEEKSLPKNQRSELDLLERINFVISTKFKRVSYTEAHEILKKSNMNKKKKFNYLIDNWGTDIQSEHERYLVEKHFKCPVIIYDYPSSIKAFYMKQNKDGKTVKAMDVLFPGIGEIIGGSQREEDFNKLLQKIKEMKIDEKELWWYLDLRKFGTVPHSGFGLGFERLIQFSTGMKNIRDVIPYPRTPQNASF